MGAWGLGLFQSDQDLDLVSDLSGEAGIFELEEQANAAVFKSTKGPSNTGVDDAGEDDGTDDGVHYSLLAMECSSEDAIEAVRKHMDNGKLTELVAKYEAKMVGGGDGWGFFSP